MAHIADRRVSLSEAAQVVQDGQILGLGGMTLYRRPVAFVRALLRRPRRPAALTLLSFMAGFEADVLVGAGCVSRARTCYFGLEAFGLAPMFTKAGAAGTIEIVEETEASLALGIRATLSGIGFLPSRAWLGTDLPRLRPDVKTIGDPYTGEELIAFPAITCDVAVIHALVADQYGNVRLNRNLAIDRELAFVAETVIVTAENVVDKLTEEVDIPAPFVTMVAHAPRGAWPTSCYPMYPIGGGEILRYLEACAADRFEAYLDDFVAQETPR